MVKLTWPLLILLLLLLNNKGLLAQDQVLFSVDGEPVHLSEFQYIYEKTNRDSDVYSEASISEYLDLYKKFKLKVRRAKDLQLDTIQSLKNELEGYRRQLANTYLIDRQVSDALTFELFERMQRDVHISHILLSLPVNGTAEDTIAILAKANDLVDQIKAGGDFADLANDHSDDQNTAKRGGEIGFIKPMLPNGFYNLESVIYELEDGQVSEPVLSKLGWHIVKKNHERPARGEMEVAHILVRITNHPNAQQIARGYREEIRSGMSSFEDLAKSKSEDKLTASKNGYLGFFGINQYESGFEEAAFALSEDGAVSEPVKTKFGWHIIKRISKKQLEQYDQMKRSLLTEVKKDGRFRLAEEALQQKLKQENQFEELNWDRRAFLAQIGNSWLSFKWDVPKEIRHQDIFRIMSSTFTTQNFVDYLAANAASRVRVGREKSGMAALEELLNTYQDASILQYEESQLEQKYPDFKALMREYEEGILLFEATKINVWDRASKDTSGLRTFHNANKTKYMWPEKAVLETVQLNSANPKLIAQLEKLATAPTSKLVKKFNKKSELLTVARDTIEQESMPSDLEWKTPTAGKPTTEGMQTTYQRILTLIPSRPKKLEEAKGYIIADYQDHLEQEWIKSLEAKYPITVNEDVLQSIIK